MDKEALGKEAEDYADRQIGCGDGYYEWTDVKQAYIESAEPREKRIEELEQKYSTQADDFENMKAGLESEIAKLKEENKQLRNNYDDYKTVSEEEIIRLKKLLLELYAL